VFQISFFRVHVTILVQNVKTNSKLTPAEESGKMHPNLEHPYFVGLSIGPRHRTATRGREKDL
jgi:hypothetical protein